MLYFPKRRTKITVIQKPNKHRHLFDLHFFVSQEEFFAFFYPQKIDVFRHGVGCGFFEKGAQVLRGDVDNLS